MANNQHYLLLSLPAQGHINPTLQLAKNLARSGASRVTFTTTVKGLSKLQASAHLPTLNGLYYASFSDGYDDDGTVTKFPGYLDELKIVGSKNLANLIQTLSGEGSPVTFLIYTILVPWVAELARRMQLPSAFLSIQSATSYSIYHRFFNSTDGIHTGNEDIDPLTSVQLPGLPSFTCHDIPSFLLPNKPFHTAMVPIMQEHIQTLEKDPNPCVLANTFDALEQSSIKYIVPNVKFISIGPLIPSSFSDGKDRSDVSFGCDLIKSNGEIEYLNWLDSKPHRSVIYVSFGSLAVLQKRQKEELVAALVESGRPFLWVIREDQEEGAEGFEGKNIENGLIVPWCSQVEVLCHSAIGCFVTHCGWNSMLESIVAGVPMVCCPQFSDQPTNAKMVEDVWGNGVRAVFDDEGVVEKEEMKRCLDAVMGISGERGEEIRKNAVKWSALAIEAVKEGGSSSRNLKEFLDM